MFLSVEILSEEVKKREKIEIYAFDFRLSRTIDRNGKC